MPTTQLSSAFRQPTSALAPGPKETGLSFSIIPLPLGLCPFPSSQAQPSWPFSRMLFRPVIVRKFSCRSSPLSVSDVEDRHCGRRTERRLHVMRARTSFMRFECKRSSMAPFRSVAHRKEFMSQLYFWISRNLHFHLMRSLVNRHRHPILLLE